MANQFTATFASGATTTDHGVACFFQIMKDKSATPEEIQGYIDIGRMADPFQNWNEIQRIADSLKHAAGKARPSLKKH